MLKKINYVLDKRQKINLCILLVIIFIGIIIDKGVFTTLENHILRKRGLL